MPSVVVKDDKTKLAMVKIAPSKGVQEYAVEFVKRFVKQLGYDAIIVKSDSEPSISALAEAVRRERSERGDCRGGVTCRWSPGERRGGKCGEERAKPVPGVEERT